MKTSKIQHRAKFASKVVGHLVKISGGNKICQQSAQLTTRIMVIDNHSAASAIHTGYQSAIKIRDNLLLKKQAF